MLLGFTTRLVIDYHTKIEHFHAFLTIFRRKEAHIMKFIVFNTDVYGGKLLLFYPLIPKIVDSGCATNASEKSTVIY